MTTPSPSPASTIEAEPMEQLLDQVLGETTTERLSCPPKPAISDCPYAKDTVEWRNWYDHFGYELIRWGHSLTKTVSRMTEENTTIQWRALGLRGVAAIQDTVSVTRFKKKPVLTTEDAGVTLAIDCDIVTYSGTGVLINKGRGVALNIGSGIILNFSTGTCTNTKDGIIVSFGKCTLVNSGTGFGIIRKSCPVQPEEATSTNDVGGMVIKHPGSLSLYNPDYTALDINCNEDSSDDSPSLNDEENWSDVDTTDLSETETESDVESYSESSCDEEESYSTEVHISIVESQGSDEETSGDETTVDAEEDTFLPISTLAESLSNASVHAIDEVQKHCTSTSEFEEEGVDPLLISEEENTPSEASLLSQAEASSIGSAAQLQISELRHVLCASAKEPGMSANNLDNTAPTRRE